ncbi:MAG TPA: hypothetical protein VM866_10305 [Pyrinomonadaceae bacterium]|jgi:hypothetical protein|nr:hypothetical protein [Pyrinomonadaceae bacterium]
MKAVANKMIVTFAVVVLVASFVAAALLVGVKAVAASTTITDDLLLVALALLGAVLSTAKSMTNSQGETRDVNTLRIAPREKATTNPGAFMKASM